MAGLRLYIFPRDLKLDEFKLEEFALVKATLLFVLLPLVTGVDLASAQVPNSGNVIPIAIKDINNQFVMEITICEPGTQKCQTIPNIVVDTGSTGLRLFSGLLNRVQLPLIQNSKGEIESECYSYSSGGSMWGPIGRADVRIGGETAVNIPIQLGRSDFPGLPSNCAHPYVSPEDATFNGVFGIQPSTTDCSDEGPTCLDSVAIDGFGYMICSGSSCQDATDLSLDNQVANPIRAFAADNNGYSITLPMVPDSGLPTLRGTLTFGIGTRTNNLPPPNTKVFAAAENAHINLVLNGKTYPGYIDSGNKGYQLPSELHLRNCPDAPFMLCPTSPLSFSVAVESNDGQSATSYQFRIRSAEDFADDRYAINNVGSVVDGTDQIVLGVPFLFGRTVYFGLPGKSSPLGVGPYYGATGL